MIRPCRNSVLLLVAAILPFPAVAQDTGDEGHESGRAAELAEKLNDPMTQYAVAGMLAALSKTFLDMEIEPVAKAMRDLGGRHAPDVPPDTTLGDLAGTNSEEVTEHLVEEVPRMMKAMGKAVGAMETMKPELKDMARRMRDAIPAD